MPFDIFRSGARDALRGFIFAIFAHNLHRNRRMIKALKVRFLEVLQRAAREVDCPQCGHRFQPLAGEEIQSFSQLSSTCVCPKCGKGFQWSEGLRPGPQNVEAEADAVVPERPSDSKIERQAISETELLYHVPASGHWGGGLFFVAIVWNLVTIPIFLGAVHAALRGKSDSGTLILIPFVAAGLGLAYATVRTRFATHLIYLSPETVRVQRALFRKKNFVVNTEEVRHVKKVEIYQQNYKPVYAIEIGGAGHSKIRFGSVLSDAEKEWFCYDAMTFLRGVGAPV